MSGDRQGDSQRPVAGDGRTISTDSLEANWGQACDFVILRHSRLLFGSTISDSRLPAFTFVENRKIASLTRSEVRFKKTPTEKHRSAKGKAGYEVKAHASLIPEL